MITLFVPYIRHFPTGGNIFNEEVIAYLSSSSGRKTELNVVDSGKIELPTAESVQHGKPVAVVDSLVARHASSREVSEARRVFTSVIMVVHYLELLDPAQSGSARIVIEKQMLKAYDGFITPSQFSRQALLSHGVSSGAVTVVRPGLSDAFRGPPKPRSGSSAVRILTVSNFSAGKGLVGLVGVLEQMMDIPWTWDVVGSGDLDEDYALEFKRRLDHSSISSRVHLRGAVYLKELVNIYDGSDIFVLPSRFESCSMVIMEAMARGLPPVAFEVGGIPETVMGSEGARLIPAGDWEALGAAVRELASRRSARISRGQQVWEASRSFPSWKAVGEEFLQGVFTMGETPD